MSHHNGGFDCGRSYVGRGAVCSLHGQRGFSLVEIVVVVAIIAVLAAIGYSVSAPAREKARQATCISQLKQIYSAVVM